MPSEAIRLAKLQNRVMLNVAGISLVESLIKNPVVELLAAFFIVEYYQKNPKNDPLIPPLAGTMLEASLVGAINLQQIASALPYISEATVSGALALASPAGAGLASGASSWWQKIVGFFKQKPGG